MTEAPRDITTEALLWHGLTIRVSYEPKWCGGDLTAHLQLETIAPARAPMPISETGYRSHFLPCGVVEEAGGPLAYATAWLDHVGSGKAWKAFVAASRQLDLFS